MIVTSKHHAENHAAAQAHEHQQHADHDSHGFRQIHDEAGQRRGHRLRLVGNDVGFDAHRAHRFEFL